MRTVLTFLFSLSLALVYSQIPNYFDNNPVWHCYSYYNDGDGTIEEFNYNYQLSGDTLISGKTYYKVYKRGEQIHDEFGFVKTYFQNEEGVYIRQENRSIMAVYSGNTTEELLISYDFKVGDTVKNGKTFDDSCYQFDTIQKIDSVLVGSEYRRRFYVDSINGPVITEGIATQNFIEAPMGYNFFHAGCQGLGFDFSIYCYGENSVPLWDYYGNGGSVSECSLNLKTNELSNNIFSFYPNPTFDNITIESEEIVDIKVTNISGQKILSLDEFLGKRTVDFKDYSKGIYIITVSDKTGSKSYKLVNKTYKLIKM